MLLQQQLLPQRLRLLQQLLRPPQLLLVVFLLLMFLWKASHAAVQRGLTDHDDSCADFHQSQQAPGSVRIAAARARVDVRGATAA